MADSPMSTASGGSLVKIPTGEASQKEETYMNRFGLPWKISKHVFPPKVSGPSINTVHDPETPISQRSGLAENTQSRRSLLPLLTAQKRYHSEQSFLLMGIRARTKSVGRHIPNQIPNFQDRPNLSSQLWKSIENTFVSS